MGVRMRFEVIDNEVNVDTIYLKRYQSKLIRSFPKNIKEVKMMTTSNGRTIFIFISEDGIPMEPLIDSEKEGMKELKPFYHRINNE